MSENTVIRLFFHPGSSLKSRKLAIEMLESFGFRRVGNSLTWVLEDKNAKIAVSLDAFLKGDEKNEQFGD